MASSQGSSGTRPRRKKGTGSIFPTKEGTYRAAIKLTELNGDLTPYSRRFPTYKEAEKYLDDLVARHRGGALVATPNAQVLTIRDLMREWIEAKYREARVSTTGKPSAKTVDDYQQQIVLWVLPALGTIEINRIHKDNIYEWIESLNRAVSDKTKKPLSHHRKARIWSAFKRGIEWGVEEGYLLRNPLQGVKGIPQATDDVLERVMPELDYQNFIKFITAKGCQHYKGYCYLRWILAINGSRRQMEVLGLEWSHVHLSEDIPYMQIQSQLSAQKWLHDCGDVIVNDEGKHVYPCGQRTAKKCSNPIEGGLVRKEGTKGGASNKPTVAITAFLDAFIEHRKKQQEEIATAKKNGTYSLLSPNHANLVFTQPRTQRPFQAKMDSDLCKRMQQEAGLSQEYRLHDLRHTAISRLVDATGNIRLVQDIAGHRTLAVTGKYAKPSLESSQDAFGDLGKMDKKKSRSLRKRSGNSTGQG